MLVKSIPNSNTSVILSRPINNPSKKVSRLFTTQTQRRIATKEASLDLLQQEKYLNYTIQTEKNVAEFQDSNTHRNRKTLNDKNKADFIQSAKIDQKFDEKFKLTSVFTPPEEKEIMFGNRDS